MNTSTFSHRLTTEEYAALMDDAKQRAVQLRREAIDEFWSDVAQLLRGLFRRALLRKVGKGRRDHSTAHVI